MTKAEREVMQVLYQCVNKITGLAPNNPCNTTLIFRRFKQVVEASKYMLWGLSNLNYEDIEEAKENMDEAWSILEDL